MANQPSAQDVISKMEQKFLKIENYQVDVSRIYHRNEVVEYREEWRFFFQDPGLVRSEIMLPKKIIMVINQDEAWHYLLEEKKVVKRRIRGLEEKERISLLGSLLKPYEIEGWGLSLSSQFGDRLKLIGEKLVKGRKCYLIECKSRTDNPPQLKLMVWIDQERLAVVKRELYKEGDQLVKSTESDNFLEVLPDIWLPRKVESTLHTEKGVAKIRLVLRNIKVNKSMPDTTFQFSPPEGCEVMTLNDKGVVVKEDKVQNAKP
jgi:outer membrane lipoprotein-sorting protein